MRKKSVIVCLLIVAAAVLVCGCTGENVSAGETPAPTTPEPAGTTAAPVGQPVPTPPGDWGGSEPYEIGFVDPATYHLPTPTPTVTFTRPPDDLNVAYGQDGTASEAGLFMDVWGQYFEIASEKSGSVMASEIFHIPFPYWAINYTATAHNSEYSAFSVEIRDANDPNRDIGEIKISGPDFINNESETNFTASGAILFREGFRDYYLVIHPTSIKSFSVRVFGPAKYMV
jgi:hypothetical protein